MVMLSGARGGAGGTSGGRATGMSQASAMLTDGLAVLTSDDTRIGERPHIRSANPGAMKAHKGAGTTNS